MSLTDTPLTALPSWRKLQQHFETTASQFSLNTLFAADPKRFDHYSGVAAGIFLDYSKNLINTTTHSLLCNLAEERQLGAHIEALFSGGHVNFTEQKPALHTALRDHTSMHIDVEQHNIIPEIRKTLDRMEHMSESIRCGHMRGYNDKPIDTVVNIGIGGSGLGPKLIAQALAPYAHKEIKIHFVSNVDGHHLQHTIDQLDPARTIFILSSKSFSTIETLENARSLLLWFERTTGHAHAASQHFFAVTAEADKAISFGLYPEHVFPLWNFVGGRYSVWSAISLPVICAVGMKNFLSLLEGAHAMDEHFRTAPFADNLPVTLALLGIWYRNFWHAPTHAVIPYVHGLRSLPTYLQQLDMESNGKSTTRTSIPTDYETGSIIWGGVGSDSQHTFFQFLHQGTELIPIDFVVCRKQNSRHPSHDRLLYAQAISQSRALMCGLDAATVTAELKSEGLSDEQIAPQLSHRTIPGNRPSNTLVLNNMSPREIGALLSLYEHKTYTQSVIWNINAFDQFSVELGKRIAQGIVTQLTDKTINTEQDVSTQSLIRYYHEQH